MKPRLQEDDVSQYWDLVRRVERLENAGAEAVHLVGDANDPFAVVFLNGWHNYDFGLTTPVAGGRNAGFYRNRERVYPTGVITGGTVGLPAFVLPVGYRPPQTTFAWDFVVLSNGAFGSVSVGVNGEVTPFLGSNVYFELEGISFRYA